jgi:hypothetical protein
MRSDALDQWLSSDLEMPVRISWEGALSDALRGRLDGVSFEIAGVATAWMPLERIIVHADHARFTPGLPARIRVEAPVVQVTVGQRDLDRWQNGFQLPFKLKLGREGLVVNTEIAGLPISEFETTLEVVRGWFVLKPRRASILGVSNQLARLFRAYLPLPPLSPDARLVGIEHATDRLSLHFGISDFEEEVTPGMLSRIRRRVLPWTGRSPAPPPAGVE